MQSLARLLSCCKLSGTLSPLQCIVTVHIYPKQGAVCATSECLHCLIMSITTGHKKNDGIMIHEICVVSVYGLHSTMFLMLHVTCDATRHAYHVYMCLMRNYYGLAVSCLQGHYVYMCRPCRPLCHPLALTFRPLSYVRIRSNCEVRS